MLRLFYGNFDFEESLVRPVDQQRPGRLHRILAELAATWVAVVEENDLIWCPQPIDKSFLDDLHSAGWPPFRFVSRPDEIPAGCELVPWGWTAEAVAFGQSVNADFIPPHLSVVRKVNSRQFALDLETSLGTRLEDHSVASSWPELCAAVEHFFSHDRNAVIKTEFSQAGRDRFLVESSDAATRSRLQNWAQRQWKRRQRLYVEPWLDAVAEVGIQFDVGTDGDVTLVGVAEMIPSPHGGYAGSVVRNKDGQNQRWNRAIAIGRRAAQAVAAEGYIGPLGIDAMQYLTDDGSVAVRPIQDLNARWTMGRLSLGLRRFLPAEGEALWLHGAALEAATAGPERCVGDDKIVPTSPTTIAGRPVWHRTALASKQS